MWIVPLLTEAELSKCGTSEYLTKQCVRQVPGSNMKSPGLYSPDTICHVIVIRLQSFHLLTYD
jgi:hypothetical protein